MACSLLGVHTYPGPLYTPFPSPTLLIVFVQPKKSGSLHFLCVCVCLRVCVCVCVRARVRVPHISAIQHESKSSVEHVSPAHSTHPPTCNMLHKQHTLPVTCIRQVRVASFHLYASVP